MSEFWDCLLDADFAGAGAQLLALSTGEWVGLLLALVGLALGLRKSARFFCRAAGFLADRLLPWRRPSELGADCLNVLACETTPIWADNQVLCLGLRLTFDPQKDNLTGVWVGVTGYERPVEGDLTPRDLVLIERAARAAVAQFQRREKDAGIALGREVLRTARMGAGLPPTSSSAPPAAPRPCPPEFPRRRQG